MNIRRGKISDAPGLAEILNDIIAIGGTTAYQTPKSPSYFDRLLTATDPKTFLHVAEADGKLCGMQWVEPFDAPREHHGGIATFARAGITQRGIGSALFQATREASKVAGYETLVAVIRADNGGGLKYYERMGFRDHAVAKAVPLTDGSPVDRIEKRLIL